MQINFTPNLAKLLSSANFASYFNNREVPSTGCVFVLLNRRDFNYLNQNRLNENSFTRVASLPCKGHPVGVDIYENDEKLEAWVCSYTNGSISIFSFNKK